MKIDLQPDGRPGTNAIEIECDPMRFGGTRSVFGSTFWLPATISRSTDAKLLELGGWLRFQGDNDGLSIPMQPVLLNEQQLRVPISDEQLARLERKRAGQVLVLELVLRGVGFFGKVGAEPTSFFSPFNQSIVLQRDEWIKILGMLGAGQRRLIELPAPPTDLGGLWDKASARIDAASWRLASGDSGAAIGEARVAMERALEAVANAMLAPRKGKEPFANFASRIAEIIRKRHVPKSSDPYATLADAIVLANKVFGFTSDPLHNGLDGAERINAELAIGIVTTLYAYFARLPNATGPLAPEAPLP